MALIVFRFGVTSSPITPSPRVAPRTNSPFSYRSEIAIPSIFGSATKRSSLGEMSSRFSRLCRRVSQARNSSAPLALPSESIGSTWRTCGKRSVARPLTRCVGESGVTSCGLASSSARSSRIRSSYSSSPSVGSSSS